MPYLDKEYTENWAYDLHKNVKTRGELWDDDVVKQSIEMIVATMLGERLFNHRFGSRVFASLFEGMTPGLGEEILDSVIDAIKTWEDRAIVIESEAELIVYQDDNSIVLKIPYQILRSGKSGVWEKKIIP